MAEVWRLRDRYNALTSQHWPKWAVLGLDDQELFYVGFQPLSGSDGKLAEKRAGALALAQRVERVPVYERGLQFALAFLTENELALSQLGEVAFARKVCAIRREVACALVDGAVLPSLLSSLVVPPSPLVG